MTVHVIVIPELGDYGENLTNSTESLGSLPLLTIIFDYVEAGGQSQLF